MNLWNIYVFLGILELCLLGANAIKNLIDKNYIAPTEYLMQLLDVEEKIIENMENYVKALKAKLKLTQQTLTKFRDDELKMHSDYETYLGNPLNSFALIRHQQQDWSHWAKYMEQKIGVEQIAIAHLLRTQLPSALDLQDACRNFELSGSYYALQPKDLAAGKLPGQAQTETVLSDLDCFALGKFNMYQKKYLRAETWFNVSIAKYDESNTHRYKYFDFEKEVLYKWLGVMLAQRKEFATALKYLEKTLSLGRDNIVEYIEAQLITKKQCTASFERPTNLHCRYNNWMTPFLRLAPLKMEELSKEPYAVLYHEVLYDSEINWFLNQSFKLKPALLLNNELSAYRTAKDASFNEYLNEVPRVLHKRMGDMSGFSLENAESLNLINYGIGGHYNLHFDASLENTYRGKRIATILFYLGDVELGGSTILPRLNLSIPPKKGTAVLWHNLKQDGEIHEGTQHAACPVIVGSKYVLTKWIYSFDQTFIQPCPANQPFTSE